MSHDIQVDNNVFKRNPGESNGKENGKGSGHWDYIGGYRVIV